MTQYKVTVKVTAIVTVTTTGDNKTTIMRYRRRVDLTVRHVTENSVT